MAKRKKSSSEAKLVANLSKNKMKGVNKHDKTQFKHSNKLAKMKYKQTIKNKQNTKDGALLKPISKQNINEKNKTKSKKKQKLKDNIKSQAAINDKSKPLKSKYSKLNINKINAMLAAKQTVKSESPSSCKKNIDKTPLSLRERMLGQLKASRFRFLNEQMYNNNSTQSKKFFQDDPHAFHAYHEGYKQQVERWPINPVDVIIESIKKMPKEHVIADFGCGEAKLADSVSQEVHSFDLVAVNDKVKACDMANTSLLTGRVNVAVFCLSLMGSNLGDYILEANRVLCSNGILKIAEVESRFEKIDDFIKLMSQYGFVNTWKDLSNDLFYFMDFKKTKDVLKKDVKKLPVITLKSCLYKKR